MPLAVARFVAIDEDGSREGLRRDVGLGGDDTDGVGEADRITDALVDGTRAAGEPEGLGAGSGSLLLTTAVRAEGDLMMLARRW